MAHDFTVADLCRALDQARIRWELIGTYGREVQDVMVRECDFPRRAEKDRSAALRRLIKQWGRTDATDKGDILFLTGAR